VKELVIDPRNDIEHNYVGADEQKAKWAVDVAGHFVRDTQAECDRGMIVSAGWNIATQFMASSKPGNEFVSLSFNDFLTEDPFLLIEPYRQDRNVLLIFPKDEEMLVATLGDFTLAQTVELAKKVREHYALPSYFGQGMIPEWFERLRDRMGIGLTA